MTIPSLRSICISSIPKDHLIKFFKENTESSLATSYESLIWSNFTSCARKKIEVNILDDPDVFFLKIEELFSKTFAYQKLNLPIHKLNNSLFFLNANKLRNAVSILDNEQFKKDLQYVCKKGLIELLKIMLKDPNMAFITSNELHLCLKIAISNNQNEIVQKILEFAIENSIDIHDKGTDDPDVSGHLSKAAINDNFQMVSMLLIHYANHPLGEASLKEIFKSYSGPFGCNFCLGTNNRDIFELLIKFAIEQSIDFDIEYALCKAVMQRNLHLVKILLIYAYKHLDKVSLEKIFNNHYGVMYSAVVVENTFESIFVIEELLKFAIENLLNIHIGFYIQEAAKKGDSYKVFYFLCYVEAHPDLALLGEMFNSLLPNEMLYSDKYLLYFAVENNQKFLVEKLLEIAIKYSIHFNLNELLIVALRKGNSQIIQILLDYAKQHLDKASLKELFNSPSGPLSIAASDGHVPSIKVLLEFIKDNGIDVDITNPLQIAAKKGNLLAVQTLLLYAKQHKVSEITIRIVFDFNSHESLNAYKLFVKAIGDFVKVNSITFEREVERGFSLKVKSNLLKFYL